MEEVFQRTGFTTRAWKKGALYSSSKGLYPVGSLEERRWFAKSEEGDKEQGYLISF